MRSGETLTDNDLRRGAVEISGDFFNALWAPFFANESAANRRVALVAGNYAVL